MCFENDLVGFYFYRPKDRRNRKFGLQPIWRNNIDDESEELWPKKDRRQR